MTEQNEQNRQSTASAAPILVLVEAVADGRPSSTAAELLGAASLVGVPVAVVTAAPGAGQGVAEQLGALGATQVLVAESEQAGAQLGSVQVAALAAGVGQFSPEAVLVPNALVLLGTAVGVLWPGNAANIPNSPAMPTTPCTWCSGWMGPCGCGSGTGTHLGRVWPGC